jgi:membrane protease YdiL (CAAX protease family)
MINSKNNRHLAVFILVQTLVAQTAMMLMKTGSVGVGKDLGSFFMSFSFYMVIYIIPSIFYLKLVNKINPLAYLRLDRSIMSGILKGILIGSLIFIFFLLRNRFRILSDIDFRKDIFLILGKILVGPLEEIPFRGFYLQKFKETMSFSKANILSSALFAFMHITVYSLSGISLVYSLAYVMIIGLWMGYIFDKTKSLWCVSIVHSIYDISIWLLF